MERIPPVYRRAVHGEDTTQAPTLEEDPHFLADLKHCRSLMLLVMEAHKTVFHLTPMNGAIGAHVEGVRSCRNDLQALRRRRAAVAEIRCRSNSDRQTYRGRLRRNRCVKRRLAAPNTGARNRCATTRVVRPTWPARKDRIDEHFARLTLRQPCVNGMSPNRALEALSLHR
jgi:hypothetical protein